MKIDWFAPDNAGSPITHYTILIREDDLITYTVELTHCNGSDNVIVTNTECNIPVPTLK